MDAKTSPSQKTNPSTEKTRAAPVQMKRWLIIVGGALALLVFLFVGFNAFRSVMIARFFANKKPPAVLVSVAEAKSEVLPNLLVGIGDLAVPKHMRRFGEAFYGRQAAYVAALDAADQGDFEKALARNIFQMDGIDDRAVRLARYVRAALGALDAQDQGAFIRGEVAFPNPEAFADA